MSYGAKLVSQPSFLVFLHLANVMERIGPILIGSEAELEVNTGTHSSAPWEELPPHRDEDQVQLDVNRAFVYYPNGGCVLTKRNNCNRNRH